MVIFLFLAAYERATEPCRSQLNRNIYSLMLALNLVPLDLETII